MTTRNLYFIGVFIASVMTVTACDGVQRDPLEKQGANPAVRPAVPPDRADTTATGAMPTDRMDTATDPTMDGKP